MEETGKMKETKTMEFEGLKLENKVPSSKVLLDLVKFNKVDKEKCVKIILDAMKLGIENGTFYFFIKEKLSVEEKSYVMNMMKTKGYIFQQIDDNLLFQINRNPNPQKSLEEWKKDPENIKQFGTPTSQRFGIPPPNYNPFAHPYHNQFAPFNWKFNQEPNPHSNWTFNSNPQPNWGLSTPPSPNISYNNSHLPPHPHPPPPPNMYSNNTKNRRMYKKNHRKM